MILNFKNQQIVFLYILTQGEYIFSVCRRKDLLVFTARVNGTDELFKISKGGSEVPKSIQKLSRLFLIILGGKFYIN